MPKWLMFAFGSASKYRSSYVIAAMNSLWIFFKEMMDSYWNSHILMHIFSCSENPGMKRWSLWLVCSDGNLSLSQWSQK